MYLQDLVFKDGIVNIKENSTAHSVHKPVKGKSVESFKKSIITNIRKRNSSIARTWDEYVKNPISITGNPLIDDYGKNDATKTGENGRGVTFAGKEKGKSDSLLKIYNLNVFASDVIPLNRKVPDSRFEGYVK